MKALLKSIAEALSESAAYLRLQAATLTHGISLMDACDASEFEAQLRSFTTSDQQREDARHAALIVASMGMTSDDVEKAIMRYWKVEIMGYPDHSAINPEGSTGTRTRKET